MAYALLMPALSPTMKAGNIARWLKKVGDKIGPGDLLVEVETDKATMEMEAVDPGVIAEILINDGATDIAVQTPIALVLEDGEKEISATEKAKLIGTGSAPKAEAPKAAAPAASAPAKPAAAQPAPAKTSSERIFVSPLAKRIAKENGLNLSGLQGSGPGGRIIKKDVMKALEGGAHGFAPRSITKREDKLIPHTGMRRAIAQRLVASKAEAPHFYVSKNIEIDKLLELRKQMNAVHQEQGIKISVNDMMIKAVAVALAKMPSMNVRYEEEGVRELGNVDISMAVSIPAGLITPIITNADQKTLPAISKETKELAKKAKEGKLKPEEFQGGSFSISNMGMFGVDSFSAILNPPQAGILAIAAGVQKPVVKDGQVKVATVMNVTLSVDHRAIDGALAADWLKLLNEIVQTPYQLTI